MKKVLKFIKDYSFGIALGIILFGIVGVSAATKLYANYVSINSSNINELTNSDTLDTAITKLYEKRNNATCPYGYRCIESHATPQVGDYVMMTPTKTSYTTDTSKTGYSSTQTINPSELNTWRVIRINGDGTIDMVSANVSSTDVYFRGQTGYKNFVGYLNVLASQYANSNYTIRTRHMGYNGQTEYLTDTASTVDSTSTTAPWTSSTTNNNDNESQGRGDKLYQTDYDLVNNIGALAATKPNSSSYHEYWLASRFYDYISATCWVYSGRGINDSGGLFSSYLYYYSSGFNSSDNINALRPIVTLKSDISYTPALGTSYDPFVLN